MSNEEPRQGACDGRFADLHQEVMIDRSPCTVARGGNPLAGIRHWQPMAAIYSSAFIISRRSALRGRPKARRTGTWGQSQPTPQRQIACVAQMVAAIPTTSGISPGHRDLHRFIQTDGITTY